MKSSTFSFCVRAVAVACPALDGVNRRRSMPAACVRQFWFCVFRGFAGARDGRAGTVEWSDGHKVAGAISLTPGKELQYFYGHVAGHVGFGRSEGNSVQAGEGADVGGLLFSERGPGDAGEDGRGLSDPLSEDADHAGNGKVVEGHLFTTVFYVENDDGDGEGRGHGEAVGHERAEADRSHLSDGDPV